MILDWVAQGGITVMGVGATYLAGLTDPRKRRWAFIVGMCVQPFWAYTFIAHEQYLMLPLCLMYGASWYNGHRLINKQYGNLWRPNENT